MSFVPRQPDANMPAGYDPGTGRIYEAPWYNPNKGQIRLGANKQMDPIQEIIRSLKDFGVNPAGAGEQMAPMVDPALQKAQQLIMQLFGGGQDLKEGMGGLVNDPISGGPMSQSPLRQRMTRGRLPGSSGQDPSMGMGY